MSATVQQLPVPRYPLGSPKTNSTAAHDARAGWPVLKPEALHGLAGEVVSTLAPETEADPVALLVTFLTTFGSAVGPKARALIGTSPHPARLFSVLVGRTAKARKGTSFHEVRDVMVMADSQWVQRHLLGGLASGEGLIARLGKIDGGVLCAHEGEFSRTLKAIDRENSTLSEILRQAWDGGALRVITKEAVEVEDSHVSVLGHITEAELRETFKTVQAANGFGNRVLFFCVNRAQLLPEGGNLDDQIRAELGEKVAEALKKARTVSILRRTSAATEIWRELYLELAEDDRQGILGGVLSRGDAQALRLSVVYALLDGCRQIEPQHVHAARALLTYSRDSAEYLFGRRLSDPNAEAVLDYLERIGGGPISKTELQKAFRGGHIYGKDLERALELLEKERLITVVKVPTGGAPKTMIALLRN
jgi:uncharacterized protein DUF3987